MPAKPLWFSRLDAILAGLRALPRPYVDRATVENLLGVGRRRAQQILAPCITDRVGANGLADREALIAHLVRLANGDEATYELRRRRRVARTLEEYREAWQTHPPVLVEAPVKIVDQRWDDLPPGIYVESGRIVVEFEHWRQALEKLLALAMAIGNDLEGFERRSQT